MNPILKSRNSTDPAILRQLFREYPEHAKVRQGLADNPHIPVELLCELARDAHAEVRAAAIRNPDLPLETLWELTRHPDPEVRCSLVRNLDEPLELLTHLAQDPSEQVRLTLARKWNLPTPLVEILAQDSQWLVRFALLVELSGVYGPGNAHELAQPFLNAAERYGRILEHDLKRRSNMTPQVLDLLSTDPSKYVLLAVVRHPMASPNTREKARFCLALEHGL